MGEGALAKKKEGGEREGPEIRPKERLESERRKKKP